MLSQPPLEKFFSFDCREEKRQRCRCQFGLGDILVMRSRGPQPQQGTRQSCPQPVRQPGPVRRAALLQ
jgi:hypothetical protein